MSTPPAEPLLVMLQVANAAFPTGAFNHSFGFETLIEHGTISNAMSLETHCRDWLRYAVAPADGAGVALAHRAWRANDERGLKAIDETLGALKLAREVRDASIRCGRALLSALNDIFEPSPLAALGAAIRAGQLDGHQGTVFGAGAAALGVSERDGVLAFLQSSLINMTSVGARLIPLGQVETQRIVARAQGLIQQSVALALERKLGDLGSATIAFDIASMEHERLTTRLCMS